MITAFIFVLTIFVLVVAYFFVYILAAFVFSRIGRKFNVGSFLLFLIPFYNLMLLCDCAGVSRWLTVGIAAPGVIVFLMNVASFFVFAPLLEPAYALLALASCVYLWGSIAERLGKNFWIWGIVTSVFMGIPAVFLAFDGSVPCNKYCDIPKNEPSKNKDNKDDENRDDEETEKRYIDVGPKN